MDPQALQHIALTVAAARSLPQTLRAVVAGLFSLPGMALARIWLRGPGDLCATCRMRPECPDQSECLHLEASAGAPRSGPTDAWDRLDGDFCRFPLGIRKVGRIGATGQALLLGEVENETGASGLARPEWARAEGIRSFAGQPLIFRSENLGVLALFSREQLDEGHLSWLRTFADQAAVAIANARFIDEIGALRDRLQLERDYLREKVDEVAAFGTIIGSSAALAVPLQLVESVAPTDATVLILGESGTGKELFARAIHESSPRREKALVSVNCAAIPKDLFESHFFGHAKGAFTGASGDRAGHFEVADGGTLFLDEVGEIPFPLQSKLLRVLQEGEYERVGETRVRKVDFRVVAATNRDLRREVQEGRFREDLYYRINVFPIELPPLRERVGDIGELARHFVALASGRFKKNAALPTAAQLRALESYPWPGNIRELQNVIQRAVIIGDGDRLPLEVALPDLRAGARSSVSPDSATGGEFVSDAEMQGRVRANLVAALEQADWQIAGAGGAAELLGLKPSTLASRMRALGIRKPGA